MPHGTDQQTWDSFLKHATACARENGHQRLSPDEHAARWYKFFNEIEDNDYYVYRAYWEVRHLLSDEIKDALFIAMAKKRLTC